MQLEIILLNYQHFLKFNNNRGGEEYVLSPMNFKATYSGTYPNPHFSFRSRYVSVFTESPRLKEAFKIICPTVNPAPP